jgi:hypothetical protein
MGGSSSRGSAQFNTNGVASLSPAVARGPVRKDRATLGHVKIHEGVAALCGRERHVQFCHQQLRMLITAHRRLSAVGSASAEPLSGS